MPLAQEISTQSPTLPSSADSRINRLFDFADLIVIRTERLVSLGKPAAVNLFLLLHLLIDLIVVLVVLLRGFG